MELAEPFSQIFSDFDEAQWAFDFAAETLERVGTRGPGDKRVAITLRHQDTLLRVNFGRWMLLDFSQGTVHLALLANLLELDAPIKTWGPFAQADTEPTVCVHTLPLDVVRAWSGNLRQVYDTSMDFIAEKFRKWKGSPYRHAHRPRIYEALFSQGVRIDLLNTGFRDREELTGTELVARIVEELRAQGWHEDDIREEAVVPFEEQVLHPDLILLRNLYPLAVIEVKSRHLGLDEIPESIIQRVRKYARAVKAPVGFIANGFDALEIRTSDGQLTPVYTWPKPDELLSLLDDKWVSNDPRLYPLPPPPRQGFEPSIPQVLAIARVLDALVAGESRIHLHMARGAGKSYALFQIVWNLVKSHYIRKILIVVDRLQVLEQLRIVFEALEPGILELDTVAQTGSLERVHLATVQMLTRHIGDTPELLEDYELLIIPEVDTLKPWEPILSRLDTTPVLAVTDSRSSADRIAPDFGAPIFSHSIQDIISFHIPELPSGFYPVQLRDIAEITVGPHIGPYIVQEESDPAIDTKEVGVVTAKDLDAFEREGISISRYIHLTEDGWERIARVGFLQSGDILLRTIHPRSGSFRIARVPSNLPENTTSSNSLIRIRVNPDLADPNDVYKFLCSSSGQKMLEISASFSSFLGSFQRITVAQLLELTIYLPETEQASEDAVENLGPVARANRELKEIELELAKIAEASAASSELELIARRLKDIASYLAPPLLEEIVIQEYPYPIAIPFQRFLYARRNIYEQVQRLIDVFEATSFFVYNVLLADMLRQPQHFYIEDKNARRAYKGYSMSHRMGCIEAVQEIARKDSNQSLLFIPELVEGFDADNARMLQEELRNRTAHTATALESQQQRLLKEFEPHVRNMLKDLEFLREYSLVRIRSFYYERNQLIRNMEVYTGVVRSSDERMLAEGVVPTAADRDHLVLLNLEDEVLDLYPMYQLVASEHTRYETHMCFLKQRKQESGVLMGESVEGAFEIELDGFEDFEELQAGILEKPPTGKHNNA